MQVISKVCAQFFEEKVAKHPISKELMSIPGNSCTIQASPTPQVVPDWVEDNEHYEMLAKDGLIIEVVEKAQKQSKPLEPAKPVEPPAGGIGSGLTGDTGWQKTPPAGAPGWPAGNPPAGADPNATQK